MNWAEIFAAADSALKLDVAAQPLDGNRMVGALDFRHLTVDGADTDRRFDYPK
jgi:hypothetical protein